MSVFGKAKKLRAISTQLKYRIITKIGITLKHELDEINISSLRVSLTQLSKNTKLNYICYNEIEKRISKVDELENEDVTLQDYQDKIIRCEWKIDNKKRKKSIRNERILSESSYLESISPKTNIKILNLNKTKYFEYPTIWLNFWNQFKSSIDKNDYITLVDKFSYLKSLNE